MEELRLAAGKQNSGGRMAGMTGHPSSVLFGSLAPGMGGTGPSAAAEKRIGSEVCESELGGLGCT